VSHAAPMRVWKLLHDPAGYPGWWEGTSAVDGSGDVLMRRVPELGNAWMPTAVEDRDGSCVVISCLASGVRWEWRILPPADGEGCEVVLGCDIPEEHAQILDGHRAQMRSALSRLVALAEDGAPPA
jgi:hypothetical protein